MKALAYLLAVLAVVLVAAVVTCSLFAVWNVGGNSDEWAGTAMVLVFVSIPVCGGAVGLWGSTS